MPKKKNDNDDGEPPSSPSSSTSGNGRRPFKIREIETRDLDKGFLDALAHLSDLGGLSTREAADVLEKTRLNPMHHILVAVDEQDEVIGTTTLLVEQKFIHGGGLVGHIEDVAVRPGHEGRGVGSAVVKAAVEMAKGIGCYKVILDCKPELIDFYERAGFHRHQEGMRIDLVSPHPSPSPTHIDQSE
jgi:glucosamine-phosphate N-acetyltransferase